MSLQYRQPVLFGEVAVEAASEDNGIDQAETRCADELRITASPLSSERTALTSDSRAIAGARLDEPFPPFEVPKTDIVRVEGCVLARNVG